MREVEGKGRRRDGEHAMASVEDNAELPDVSNLESVDVRLAEGVRRMAFRKSRRREARWIRFGDAPTEQGVARVKQAGMDELEELFSAQLTKLYAAERCCEGVLHKLARAARSTKLRTCLKEHNRRTTDQVVRLKQVFGYIGVKAIYDRESTFAAIADGCISGIANESDPEAHDAAVIGAIQTLGSLKIAGYGCARVWARQLGYEQAAELLGQALAQEKCADRRMAEMAENLRPKTAHRRPGIIGNN